MYLLIPVSVDSLLLQDFLHFHLLNLFRGGGGVCDVVVVVVGSFRASLVNSCRLWIFL